MDIKKSEVFTPTVIEETPFPGTVSQNATTQAGSGGTFTPTTIKGTPLPIKVIAHETMGSALNTKARKILKTFEFALSGAIQIGKYLAGVSGDIKISPDGIVARNSAGLTTFALDGDTGDATFKGTIQAGAYITENGRVQVSEENGAGILILDSEGKPAIFIGVTD